MRKSGFSSESPSMRWYTSLVIAHPYFLVGFVDEKLTVPSIGTFFYMGMAALDEHSPQRHVFQDAHSFLAPAGADAEAPPSYVSLDDDDLNMVADQQGLARWLLADPADRG